MARVKVDDLVVAGRGLGRVTRVGKHAGAEGAWVVSSTGDPGSTTGYPTFSPDFCLKLAVVGETVCPKPRFECFCGLTHVTAEQLGWLPKKEAK